MNILKRMLVIMAALTGVMGLNAEFASAATQHTTAPAAVVHITAPALMGSMASPLSSNALGYCGPGITSKSQVVSYYASHPGTAVETYIRSNRAYYHLQADQSFGTYLNSPHVKVFPAPKGYRIKSNTYCPTSSSIAPYFGHYAVGGVLMLWYCQDVRGYNCVPIAKGYCNNIVTGKQIRPVPKKAPKPKKPKPTPKSATLGLTKTWMLNGVAQNAPEGAVQFAIADNGKAVNTVTNPVPGATRALGNFTVGHNVCATELAIPSNSSFAGYVPQSATICHVVVKNDRYAFAFVNIKNVSVVVQNSCPNNTTFIGVVGGQTVCQSQSNTNTTTQNGQTSGQGSPVINVNVTQQDNQQQNQNQGQQTIICNGAVIVGNVCSTTTTTPPATTPTVTLSLSNLTQPQNGPGGVMPDGEGPIGVCVTVQGKSGDTIKLGFGATYGSFTNSIVTLTSSGTDRACANYTAPNDAGDVGKTETWTVTGTDTTANVNASPATVNFTFQPLPGGDTSGNR